MSEKYYLCNDIRFLNSTLGSNINISSAAYMKMSKATSFVASHPNYGYFKARSVNSGKNYVLCTKMKFLGNDLTVVSDFQKAKVFSSVTEAYEYLENNKNTIDKEISFVVDNKFSRKKRPVSIPVKDVQPEDIYSCVEGVDTSERINIPQYIKEEVYNRSGGVCSICGKQLSKYAYTIDHILPLSRGGTNDLSNLRAVHKDCNRLKGNFTDQELTSNVMNIVCNCLYNSPTSRATAKLFRTFVRGVISANRKM